VTTVNASTTSGNPISIDNNTTTPTIELLSATSARNGYLTSTDWTTFNGKQAALGFTPANSTITIATTPPLEGGGNLTANRTLSITQATTSANGFLTSTDWNTFNGKQNTLVSGTTIKTVNGTTLLGSGNLSVGTLVGTDTVSLSNRINLKLNPSDTVSLSNRINLKFNTADTSQLNLTSRFAAKLNYTDTSFLFTQSDTNQLNLTNRFAAKQNNIALTTTGTSGLATFNGTTLNIPNYTASGGTGTVTSVGLTAPSIFNVGGSPVTTSGTLALTYSGDALPIANGGTGATTQANARITLGGTTSGISLFTLTNSVSDKFIKVNSNNTITLLNANDTRTAIGAGTGSVSSVGMTVPTFLFVSGSPVTSSGTLAVSLSGVPLPVLNGGTGGANEADARNQLGAACKSCTETLSGNKTFTGTINVSSTGTFGGRVNTPWLERTYTSSTATSLTVSVNTTWLNIHQDATVTLTLPNAATYPGKELIIKQTGSGVVFSASSNIIGFTTAFNGATQTAIINPVGSRFATLVSDGTNWIIMQRDN
jgi:hypothetical protein